MTKRSSWWRSSCRSYTGANWSNDMCDFTHFFKYISFSISPLFLSFTSFNRLRWSRSFSASSQLSLPSSLAFMAIEYCSIILADRLNVALEWFVASLLPRLVCSAGECDYLSDYSDWISQLNFLYELIVFFKFSFSQPGRYNLSATDSFTQTRIITSLQRSYGGFQSYGCLCPVIPGASSILSWNEYVRYMYSIAAQPPQVFNPATNSCIPVSSCPNGTVDFYTPTALPTPLTAAPIYNPYNLYRRRYRYGRY